ncbi:hypothetical protein PV04_08798 [Phialophora macrospora]|uniref:Zn(2)-C6 fungal-type domain-containing protein n=1 Tax=Phialophora macrospora TaxID=1851006 RepID=A0A0D2CFB2_9EURO|nr:hypothetical protein PV04_08798 [Phialophora macrospora]
MNAVDDAQSRRRACVRCATAKARCTFNGTEGCDRCRRLKRECILEETPRRKREKQSTRVKALEEKVNTLLSLLGPEKVPVASAKVVAIDARTPAPTEDGYSPLCRSANSATAPPSVEEGRRSDVIDHGLLNMSTADALLSKYKRVHSTYFPFVIVAPQTDAATLRTQSPVLFLAIMTTCLEGDHMLQRRLGVELKKVLCERVMIGNERDLGLLQGLLVLVAWNHFHFSPMSKQLFMLLQMAVGLVTDLDLDRCPAHRDQRVASHLCLTTSNPSQLGQGKYPVQCRRSSAEIRALLGCFYLCSSMAMLRKELAMRHTKWIDNCCHILEAEQEAPTDIYVTALVNTRCLVQSVGERFSYDDITLVRLQNDVVINMSLNGFKKAVTELEAGPAFSPTRANYSLLAELKALPIIIHEVALYRDWANAPSSPSSHSSHLWDLLTSCREFLNFVLSVPSESVIHLPSTIFNLLPYALIVLSTVSRLPPTSGWDSAIAKREADATTLGLRIKAKFGDELTKTGPDVSIEQKDVWQYFSRGIGGLVAWHQRCEMSSSAAGESELEVPLSSPSGVINCGVADAMNAFVSMRIRNLAPLNFGNLVQDHMTANVASGHDAGRGETQPDAMMNLWDDEAWQSILDDFSMFPTTAGFPVGQ